MEQLSSKALSNVASYLDKTTRALFAVALTAPSSSWERFDLSATLSETGEIVLSSPYYRCKTKEYEEKWESLSLEENLDESLTDGDIFGILVSIDAKKCLKYLSLPDCVSVRGHGLSPLSTSVILQEINLIRCTCQHTNMLICQYGSDGMMPSYSESRLLPILHSIIETEGSSLGHLILPKPCREIGELDMESSVLPVLDAIFGKNRIPNMFPEQSVWKEGVSKELAHFLDAYNRYMNNRMVGCSTCNASCFAKIGRPWISSQGYGHGIAQNYTCHDCMEHFCSDCEIENGLKFCPCCQVNYCHNCLPVETCIECQTIGCNVCKQNITCSDCKRTNCGECNTTSLSCAYCDICELWLCKDCTIWRRCKGKFCSFSVCSMHKSIDNLEQCKLCGDEYCNDCNLMEYCSIIGGNVCQECKCDNLVALPFGVQQILTRYATEEEEINMCNLVEFWYECVQLCSFGTDKEFDLNVYENIQGARRATTLIIIDLLLEDNELDNKRAVYYMFYGAYLKEVMERGPDFLLKIYKKKSKESKSMITCTYFGWFSDRLRCTRSRSDIIKYIGSEIIQVMHREKCINRSCDMLSKVHTSELKLHNVESLFGTLFSKLYGVKRTIDISIVNIDQDRKKSTWYVCKDATLAWWLKFYAISNAYWLKRSNITIHPKYFRIVHKDKTIFLSSSGRRTFDDLGIQANDEIILGGVESIVSNGLEMVSAKQRPSNKKQKKNKTRRPKKNKKKNLPVSVPTEEDIKKRYRETHSKAMSRVFEELDPLLKQIRTRLHNLTLHKSAPKVRKLSSRKKDMSQAIQSTSSIQECEGGKAGKIAYCILVGEAESLYKSSKTTKSSRRPIITLDLHGYSTQKALKKLDESLPIWVETAMKGTAPRVIPIDIICGSGKQVLSEVVKEWIRNNGQVANRPKNYC